MCGAKGVHAIDIAQRGVLDRQFGAVLAFADIHAAVFQQHQIAGRHIEAAIHPVTDQTHFATQMMGKPCRHRCQRIRVTPLTFRRSTKVRGHHHRCAFLQSQTKGRQYRCDALFRGDLAVLDRHVQVFTNQHTFANQIEVSETQNGHGKLPKGEERCAVWRMLRKQVSCSMGAPASS
ncbi:MAG: hypothetical protein BWZ07_01530 [Alphaproteobacteria bacterium ADurb.BinA280]|nr:MAG: hypothetical protein BWZ07_01530 [Alphaproteobacteria bacterium ADurb.BinA280]